MKSNAVFSLEWFGVFFMVSFVLCNSVTIPRHCIQVTEKIFMGTYGNCLALSSCIQPVS